MKEPVNKCMQQGGDSTCCFHEESYSKPQPGCQLMYTAWRCCFCNMVFQTYHGPYAPYTPYVTHT